MRSKRCAMQNQGITLKKSAFLLRLVLVQCRAKWQWPAFDIVLSLLSPLITLCAGQLQLLIFLCHFCLTSDFDKLGKLNKRALKSVQVYLPTDQTQDLQHQVNRKPQPQTAVTRLQFRVSEISNFSKAFSSVQFSSFLFSQNIIPYKNTHRNCNVAREPRGNQKAL